jgi:hypothetical protein
LGEVLCIVEGTRETIANVEDTPVVALDDFFPSNGVA